MLLQNLQFFAKFQFFQLENLVEFEKMVFSFFDFRSSFPVFPTSLKLRAKKKGGNGSDL